MKLKLIIDPSREEEIIIFAHEKNQLVIDVEKLVNQDNIELIGYIEREAEPLNPADIYCFTVEDNKVYALTEKNKYTIRGRLYQLEEKLPDHFIKINQSCIANIKKIKKFDATFTGTLRVVFKNGYTEYVSRRNIKKVKERLGL